MTFEEWWKMVIDRDMDGFEDDVLKAEYRECWNAAASTNKQSTPCPHVFSVEEDFVECVLCKLRCPIG